MKTILKSAILFSGIASSYANFGSQPESGANCNISAAVDCRLQDGSNRVCAALENEPYTNCGNIKVTWKYTFCNHNGQKMYFHEPLFEPLLHNVEVSSMGFDKSEMKAGECRDVTVPKEINSCDKRNTVASLKLEGNLSGKWQGGDNYCYAWAFSKQRIGQPPLKIEPINDPADISLQIICRYESIKGSTFFNQDCSGIRNKLPRSASECVIPVEYTYTVINQSANMKAKVQAVIDEETTNVLTVSEELRPFERSMSTIRDTINICESKGTNIEKKAVALAASFPSGVPGSATASLTIPTPTLTSDWEVIDTQCQYNGSPCSSFSTCITGEAMFTYKLKNTGYVCNDVEKVTVSFGADGARPLALDNDYLCSDRESCPGDVWTLSERRYIDTCTSSNAQIVFGVHVTNGSATAIGHWSGPSGPSGISGPSGPSGPSKPSKPSSPSGIAPSPHVPLPHVPSRPSNISPSPPAVSPTHTVVCTKEATQLTFVYHGGHSCRHGNGRKRNLRSGSKKKQEEDYVIMAHSSSHSSTTTSTSTSITTTTIISHSTTPFCNCNDFSYTNASQLVNIEVTSQNQKMEYSHISDLPHGTNFVVSAGGKCDSEEYLKNNLAVKIYNTGGHIVQSVDIHTGDKCLEELLGKPMGSVTLTGWA